MKKIIFENILFENFNYLVITSALKRIKFFSIFFQDKINNSFLSLTRRAEGGEVPKYSYLPSLQRFLYYKLKSAISHNLLLKINRAG